MDFPALAQADEPIAWKCIGKVRARSAQEIHSSNWSVGAETMDRDYTIYANWKDYLGPLGIKKARIQAGWAKTEKIPGQYDWAWLDEIIGDMAAQSVEPWVCLCYGNSLYAEGGGTRLGAVLPKDGKSLEAWLRFVRAFVDRYKTYVDEWEIWNEPNLRQANAAEDYANFLIRTAEMVRGIQPRAQILAMSVAGIDHEFVGSVLKIAAEQGKLDLIDEITYHPYSYNPDKSYSGVAKLREVVQRYDSRIGIRQGENGAPSERRKTKALSNYDWSETSQAKWALRRMLGDLGRDIPSSYFSIIDMKYPDEMNRKGLLKATDDKKVECPKVAYYAVQNLAAVFDSTLRRIEDYPYETRCEKSLSVFAYESKATGRQVVSLWFDGENPGDDNTKTPLDITFAKGGFIEPVLVDLRTGEVHEIPKDSRSKHESQYTFQSIPCYDSPILIADKSIIGLLPN